MTEEPMIPGIDLTRPNVARMYDYLLGGAHNFAADRELADRVAAAEPAIVTGVWATRSFVRRAVVACVERGVDQFLDLGSGIPTVGNVHEVARRHLPEASVAYVDHEPVAVHHSRELLHGVEGVSITHADLREPAAVLAAPTVTEVIDFDRPVAVLMLAVLHFVPDEVHPLVAAYRAATVPGSALAISHGSVDWDDPDLAQSMRARRDAYRDSSEPLTSRSRHEIAALFGHAELVPPGLVDIVDWRPDSPGASPSGVYGGVGFVP